MTTSTIEGFLEGDDADPPFSSLGAIDRIGDAFCQADQDLRCLGGMQDYRSFRMRCLGTTLAIVDACQVPGRATVSVRLKRLRSIRLKIERAGSNFKLGRLDDVVGVRVICENLSAVRELSGRIGASPYFHRLKDYIAEPAATGYRGINHIMRFPQPVTETTEINMRFEIQARTYLQHRWAVWSESQGEAVKLGVGDTEEHKRLRALSGEVALWEADNPDTPQITLPDYAEGRHSIAVCWRPPRGPAIPHFFGADVQEAVTWLRHLENNYPASRDNALLLVGVTRTTDPDELTRLMCLTHPLFVDVPVPGPDHWMPPRPS